MGFSEMFLYKSKEKRQQEQAEFEQRIFPFGQKQRDMALAVLREIDVGKLRDADKLYIFIAAKDYYLQGGQSAAALKQSAKQLRRFGWLKKQNLAPVLALVQLDAQLKNLSEYPGVQQVLQQAQVNTAPVQE